LSKNITNIYLVSWVIYGICGVLIGYNMYGDIISALLGIMVIVKTHVMIKYTKINQLIPKI